MSASSSASHIDSKPRDQSGHTGTQHDALKHAGPDGKALPHTAAVRSDQVETNVAPAAGAPMPSNDEFQAAASPAERSRDSSSSIGVDRESSNLSRDIEASKASASSKPRADMSIDLSKRDADEPNPTRNQGTEAAQSREESRETGERAAATDGAAADKGDKDKQSWTSAIGGAIGSFFGSFSPRGANTASTGTGNTDASPKSPRDNDAKRDAAAAADTPAKTAPTKQPDTAGERKDKRKSWTSLDDENHPDYKSAADVPQQPEHLPNAPWTDAKQFEREVKEHRSDDLQGISNLKPQQQAADTEDPAERWLEKNSSCAADGEACRDKATSAADGEASRDKSSSAAAAAPAVPAPSAASSGAATTKPTGGAWTGASNPILAASPSKQEQERVDPSEAWLRQEGAGFEKPKADSASAKQGHIDFKALDRADAAKEDSAAQGGDFADKWATASDSVDPAARKLAQADKIAGEVTRTPPMQQRGEASLAK